MAAKYPFRPFSHVLATRSETFFKGALPAEWTAEEQRNDYGVDFRVEIFEQGQATALEFLVQLKSSARSSEREWEPLSLKVATYTFLWDKLQVVMLVKYVQEDNEAYWLLLKDVPQPDPTAKTFTVRVPKANTLSGVDWQLIRDYVRSVSTGKIQAWRGAIDPGRHG